MNLTEYLSERRKMVEEALSRLLPSVEDTPSHLHEAIRYSVLAPGKRLRPILVMAGAEAVGGDARLVIPTACALECIHAFSLIHDDLPCMDDDEYRRGRLTNHKVYGEAHALLAGDALLALAFELIAHNADCFPAEKVVEAVGMIARASGTWGMVGGQVVDIESEGKEISTGTLHYIHAHKTGALLTASVVSGASLCGANSAQKQALLKYGQSIGLAFQIADDILDVVGDEEKIGKPVGSDEKQNKATYPRIFGLEESKLRAQQELEHSLGALRDFDEKAEPLRAIARYIVERDI
jgi:geranylgeranyl diphosphate synthase type II